MMSSNKLCRLILIMAIVGLSSIATAQQESGFAYIAHTHTHTAVHLLSLLASLLF